MTTRKHRLETPFKVTVMDNLGLGIMLTGDGSLSLSLSLSLSFPSFLKPISQSVTSSKHLLKMRLNTECGTLAEK
jgi:hypothetical protein